MYAFCNTHDISWGTKDLNKLVDHTEKGDKEKNVLFDKDDYKVKVEQRRRK